MILALRSSLLWTLCWMFAIGFQFISLQASAKGIFSPVMYRMTEQPVRGLPNGLNPYHALGLYGAETQVTAAMIEAAGQKRLAILEQRGYRLTPEFEARLATASSRQALLAELSEASYLIRVAAGQQGTSLNLSQEAAQLMEKHTRQWQSSRPGLSLTELDQRARATALAEVIENHQGRFGSGALKQRSLAFSTLSDVNQRYQYDFRAGLREGRAPLLPRRSTYLANRNGFARIVLPGTGGKTIDIPVNQQVQTPMSETMKNIREGVGNYGMAAGAFLLLAFTYGVTKMTLDYASNPLAFEDILKQYITPVYLLSFFTFGAAATSYQYAHRALIQKNIEILYDLSRNGHLFANKPLERMRVAKSAFAGLSGMSLAFGFAASMGVHYLGSKALSCFALLQDGPMSRADREQHEQTCDMSFQEFLTNAWPSLASVGLSLFAARWLMIQAGNLAEGLRGVDGVYSTTKEAFAQKAARFNNRYNDPKLRNTARQGLFRGMKRGLPGEVRGAAKTIRFFRTAGAITIHMAGFVILVEVLNSGIQTAAESTGRGWAVGSKEGHLRQSFKYFVENGLDLAPFCTLPLDENGLCPQSESVFNELRDYSVAIDDLRLYHMRDMSEVTSNWTRYFSNALNMYQASSLFYKDVLDQVTAQRRWQSQSPFRYFETESGELAPRTYLEYAKHPLPLFRSSPLFGVRPEYVNESWFEGLTYKQAMEPGRWESAEAETDLQFVEDNQREKTLLAQQTGEWLLSQITTSGLPEFLKEHAQYIGTQLASGNVRSQVSGLMLLHESSKIFPWSGPLCRKNERSAQQPECLFYFAQQMMMDVLLGAAELIEEELDGLPSPYQLRAQTIVELLRSPFDDARENGMTLLKEIVAEIEDTQAVACETATDGLCVFRDAERLASSGPFNHRNRPDYGGFVRELSARPDGPLPLAPGHKYFMDFYTSLESFGIDYDWYPAREAGGRMGSMSHYLLTSMLCGPDLYSENTPTITRRLGGLIPAMPQFHPPRLPTVSGQNHCQALKDETSIYHSIVSGGQRWHGIVDLLFHDVATDVTGGEFTPWWESRATVPFENLIAENAARYGDELRTKLRRVLTGPDGFLGKIRSNLTSLISTGEAVTYLDSLNSELDVYFWSLFYPLYNDPDTLWYEPSLPEGTDAELETFKIEYLSFLESELREGLEIAITEGTSDPDRLDEAFAQVDLNLNKLKQLFGGYDNDYFNAMVFGLIDEYPQLSYRNRKARGSGYDANYLMREVFARLENTIGSLKLEIQTKASFFETLQENVRSNP